MVPTDTREAPEESEFTGMTILLLLILSSSVWAEGSLAKEMAQGTVTALEILVGGAGSMWLLFWLVGKKGGFNTASPTPHKVEDVGPIDRQKATAFANKEREAMRQPTPDWDKKIPDAFDMVATEPNFYYTPE